MQTIKVNTKENLQTQTANYWFYRKTSLWKNCI